MVFRVCLQILKQVMQKTYKIITTTKIIIINIYILITSPLIEFYKQLKQLNITLQAQATEKQIASESQIEIETTTKLKKEFILLFQLKNKFKQLLSQVQNIQISNQKQKALLIQIKSVGLSSQQFNQLKNNKQSFIVSEKSKN
ncbi:hypothetical protein ABPG74_018003 [Tetrahymena malaccensis]